MSRISNGHQVQGSASLPRWPSTKPIYSTSSYLLPRLKFNKLLCIQEIVPYNFHFPTSHGTHVILRQERLERLESIGGNINPRYHLSECLAAHFQLRSPPGLEKKPEQSLLSWAPQQGKDWPRRQHMRFSQTVWISSINWLLENSMSI